MKPDLFRFDRERFRWQGVPDRVYKEQDASLTSLGWRGVTRNTLFSPDDDAASFAVRYFEIEPGGHSTLEKHRHLHAVTVVRGAGKIILGKDVRTLRPFDFLIIPAWVPHQFINLETVPFGFLCVVDRLRDRPQPLTPEELRELREHAEVAAHLRL